MRVLAILDTLARSGEGMTMADICRELEAPKSSLFPILHTMAEEGYLACSEADGRYRIGFRTYLAGKAYNREKDALGILTEQLQRIVDDCGETSQLGILSHGSASASYRISAARCPPIARRSARCCFPTCPASRSPS